MIHPCIVLAIILTQVALQDGWDPEDVTFDPEIQSVVIGDHSWIGDPSPLIHVESGRTGYTHVQGTKYEGMDPAIQISLIFPLEKGDTVPPAGGMLMLNDEQTKSLRESWGKFIETSPDQTPDPVTVETSLPQMKWALSTLVEGDTRFIQLENQTEDGVNIYRFTINASKKLLGAIEHSHKNLLEEK